MKFSVIIPTYNGKNLLRSCLNSIFNQDYSKSEYEVIVIDDGSTDGTNLLIPDLKKKHFNLRYFKIHHKGQNAARNFGLRKARGEFIAFTDDDCLVEPYWLKKIEYAFSTSHADGIGGAILNPTNKYIAWSQYLLNFSSWFPKGKRKYVTDIPTANLAFRKTSILSHFFPEYIGKWGYGDSLFNYSLRKKDKKILFCPHIRIKHITWEKDYGMGKFLEIQKKAAVGFVLGGYKVHGKFGKMLMSFRFLNLFCPRLLMIFLRCIKRRYLTKFLFCFPLIFLGEFYRNLIIISSVNRKISDKVPHIISQ